MTERRKLEGMSRVVGQRIAAGLPPGVGFALLVFDFGPGGNLAYISNAQRDTMLTALREFIGDVEAGRVTEVDKS